MKLLKGVLCVVVLFSGIALAEERVRLAVGEWPPYVSQTLPHYGFASHLTTEAFAAVGVTVQYDFFPWKRAFEYARRGQGLTVGVWHGTLPWVYSEARADDFLYSDIVVTDDEVLFHLKSEPLQWKTLEDLQGKIIGGTLYTIYPLLDAAERMGIVQMERLGDYDVLFNRLLMKRIDAIPQVKRVADFYFKQSLSPEQRDKVTYSPTLVQRREYYLMLSKSIGSNQQLLERFNEGLRRLKKSGRYDELLQQLEAGVYDHPIESDCVESCTTDEN
ncbi:ABC transporter substrate-binding protein [Aestuariirhabdus sp. Z084]|uniref:substrate-binding periplasmic protein n=1 Tax=Aestuariirhabdus haliotis TaxID=2918751 RepID=UPI00201B408F|nr:transporter substrate-binding domain-containing protein [Aestuariirhabdus haliotis]MCL6416558.1 ABC transporter substrate-binding protein [Aestuariirhabdus haliotis]MCL6420575.1 ABC transporter substrate-binding protein [Aestuariirhabdus haliotis]